MDIPDGVTELKDNVFLNCKSLTSIAIPSSVTLIGSSAFSGCGNLSSINIPDGVTELGDYVFSGCKSLTSIIIPNGVTSIGNDAFYDCSGLTSITIPNSVASVGYTILGNCDNIESVAVGNLELLSSILPWGYQGELVILCDMPSYSSDTWIFGGYSFKKVVIGDGVTSIGDYAFSDCTSLESVTISSSVTHIGYSVFNNCWNLRQIIFEDGSEPLYLDCNYKNFNNDEGYYESEGQGLFYDCPLETLYLGRNLSYDSDWGCGYSPFYEKRWLETITVGDKVTYIGGWNTFSGCENLTFVNISSLESWCNINFEGSNSNPLSFSKNLYLNGELVTDLIIPNTVTRINDYVFCGCESLSSVTIPESVNEIEYGAFSGCSNLTSVNVSSIESWCNISFDYGSNFLSETVGLYLNGELVTDLVIPNTVTEIKAYAFLNCVSLTSIVLPEGVTKIGDSAFSGCYDLESITIPNSVTGIEYAAFSGCSKLSSVAALDGVTTIGDYAFYGCSNLDSITIPNGVTSIGNSTFSNCSSLKSVNIPNGVTSIGNSAFSNCGSLINLTIPESVNSIGQGAFYNGVKRVDLRSIAPPVLSSSKDFISDYGIFVIPDVALQSYQTAELWSDFVDYISTEEMSKRKVTLEAMGRQSALHQALGDSALPYVVDLVIEGTINSYDFMVMLNKMNRLRFLDLSNAHVVYSDFEHYTGYHTEKNKLPAYAFYHKNLVSIRLPQDITSIGEQAFSGCSALTSIAIPESVMSVGDYAFSECRGLANIKIEGSVSIGQSAFVNCSRLTEFVKTTGTVSIGSYAFQGCSSLTTVILNEVSSIGREAFGQDYYLEYKACNNLTSFTVLNGLSSIDSYAFGYCTRLKEVNLSKGLTSIGSSVFYECSSLKGIDIPDGVTAIGGSAFFNCSSLGSVKFPTTLQTISSSAFANCSNLAEVHIPSSVRNIYDNAFSGCSNMKKVYVYTIEPTTISQNTFAKNSNNNFYGTLYAPKVSYYVYWYDTQWSQFEDIQPFDEPYDNFYLKGDLELNDSTGVVQGNEGEKPDAELGSNSGLVTDGNIDQELGDVEIEHNGTNGGSIIAGGNSSVEVDNLTFRITVTGGRWYFFCFPFDVRREDIRCENGADWVFRYYDGEERAQNGRGGWKNVTSDGDGNHLKAATGYIFQCSKSDVLVLSAKNQKIKQEKKYNELVEHVTQNMQDASWNFVGNPYLSYYDITGEEYSAPITIWNGSSYVAIRPGDDDYVLSPFEAFFVQKPEGVNDIEYDPEQQMTYYQMRMAAEMKAARRRTQTINPDRLLVNLTLSDTSTTDRTRVVFNNEVSLDYEMDCDAAKFTANGVPQLYTIGNRAVKYAINERPVAEGIVTVGYTAPVQGNYTLAAPRMDVPVCLKDNRTGIIHDFSEGSYTFMTEAGTFEDRFTLMMKSDATSIDKSQLIIDEEAPLYNTKGQWVDEPQGQGVYIKDNRKVVKL